MRGVLLTAFLLLGACKGYKSNGEAESQGAAAPSPSARVAAQPFAAVATATTAITSAYTALDLAACRVVEQEVAGSLSQCDGYAGIPLFVDEGDLRFDVSAGAAGREDACSGSPNCAFNHPSNKVEWRLANGKPFAIIYRLDASGDGNVERRTTSRLIVESVGAGGCRIANLDGGAPDANSIARRAADALLTSSPRCIDGLSAG